MQQSKIPRSNRVYQDWIDWQLKGLYCEVPAIPEKVTPRTHASISAEADGEQEMPILQVKMWPWSERWRT
jgi:hypothetical protein